MIPTNNVSADNFDYDIIKQETSDSQTPDLTNEMNIPYNASLSEETIVNNTDPIIIEPVSTTSAINISLIEGRKNILNYSSNFFEYLEEGSGTLPVTYNPTTFNVETSIQQSEAGESYSIPLDVDIFGNETIGISLDNIELSTSQDAFYYFSLDFVFDQFTSSFVFRASSSYRDLLTNDSEMLQFEVNQSNIQIPLSEIHQLRKNFNDSNLNASILDKIELIVFSNTYYDFDLSIDNLFLQQRTKQILLENNKILEKQTHFKIIDHTLFEIKPIMDTSGLVKVVHYYSSQIITNGTLIPEDDDLKYSTLISWDWINLSYQYILDLSIFESTQTNGTEYIKNNNDIIINSALTRLDIVATLKQNHREVYPLSRVQQGENVTITGNSSFSKVLMLHSVNNEVITFQTNQYHYLQTIPELWPRGKVLLFILFTNGSYALQEKQLKYSPSSLAISKKIDLSPMKREVVPIILRNETSGEEIIANRIHSYIDNQLRAVDGEYGLVIEPAEIQNNFTIFVNASAPGLLPVTFYLQVNRDTFEPELDVSVQRTASTNFSIRVQIPDYYNWTTNVNLILNNTIFNVNSEITVIEFYNDTWKSSDDFSLNGMLKLDYNMTSPAFTVKIPQFNQENNSVNDRGINFLPILIITTLILGGIGYHIVKRRSVGNSITF